MKKYNHAYDLGFSVQSDQEEATPQEILEAMEKRLNYLKANPDEVLEACGKIDSSEDEKQILYISLPFKLL